MIKLNTITNKILLVAVMLHLGNFFLDNQLVKLLSLQPFLVIDKLELWRLITYPFAGSSLEGSLLFILALFFFGNKLEFVLQKTIYPVLLFLLVSLQGAVFTLLFWQKQFVFYGMEGIAIFILTLFSYMFYKNKLRIGFYRNYRIISTAILFSMIWVASVLLHFFVVNDYSILVKNSFVLCFGFITGTMMFLQFRLVKKIRNMKDEKELRNVELPKPEELSLALISQGEFKRFKQHLIEETPQFENDFPLNEDILNEILEKIHDKGKDSLTNDERYYLEEYSKRI